MQRGAAVSLEESVTVLVLQESVTMRADLLAKAAREEAETIAQIDQACEESVSYKTPMYFSQVQYSLRQSVRQSVSGAVSEAVSQ